MDSIYEIEVLERILDGSEKPRNLPFSVFKHITGNFKPDLKVGRGGFGEVYTGVLRNGIVAVKRLFSTHTMENNEFKREAQSMIKTNHENIIRLIGYCSHTEHVIVSMGEKLVMAEMPERLLCLEYMSNGSLDKHVTDELRGLEWHTRYNIINGICKGLNYLHGEMGSMHLDLKPANILLDEQMVPKIADFGLSRPSEMSHTTSECRFFTLGYCAPEYQFDGKMSPKSDIYSLGIIITELVTGSRGEPDITNVLRRWKHRWAKSCKQTLLEYRQVKKCIALAQNCKSKDPSERPSIHDILNALSEKEIANCNATETDQVASFLDDMIGIEPLELHFPFERNKEMSCSLKLTNDTNNYYYFKILTTSLLQYCIQPEKDVIPPRSSCSVMITLQAQEQAPKVNHWMNELSVHSNIVSESLTAMDITEHVFNVKAGKVVDKVNLTIVFNDQSALPEEPSRDLLISALRAALVEDIRQSHMREARISYDAEVKESDDAEAKASDDASSLVEHLQRKNALFSKLLTDLNQKLNNAEVDKRVLKADVETLGVKVKMAEDAWRVLGRSPKLNPWPWVAGLDLPSNDTWVPDLPPIKEFPPFQGTPSDSAAMTSIGAGARVDDLELDWDPHADGGL